MVALFIITKITKNWKQLKRPSTGEWISKLYSIHTGKYYSAIKRNQLLPYATAWMNLKHIMQSEKSQTRASLVAQWLRICLPMQETWVRAQVWEDPTCHRAAGPMSHNYWACASGACALQQGEAATVRGPRTVMRSGPHLPQLEKALTQKRRPNTAKNK